MPTTSVRRRITLFNLSCGLLDQIWAPVRLREAGERQDVRAGVLQHLRRGREPLGKLLDHPRVLRVRRGCIGLGEQHDEWAVVRRYLSAESLAKARLEMIDGEAVEEGRDELVAAS
jgi:hypothetical protein